MAIGCLGTLQYTQCPTQVSVDSKAGHNIGDAVALTLGGHTITYTYRPKAGGALRELPCIVKIGMFDIGRPAFQLLVQLPCSHATADMHFSQRNHCA
jgi:hypothetical protein